MYQANSFRRPTAATSPEGGGLENEARRGCMVGASPKNISSTLRSSETMIAVSSRPSAGWNRWVKKDPFLTYAPLGDPSCANMKQKPCGFREAPALRALAGASPKNVSSFLCRGFVRALCFTTRRCSQTTRVLLCRFPQNFRYGNNIALRCRPFSAILEKKDKQRGKRP